MLSKISLKLEAKLEGIIALTPVFYLSQLKTGDKVQFCKICGNVSNVVKRAMRQAFNRC